MNRHTARVLEFDKIRARLVEYCLTAEGPRDLLRERIRCDPEEVEALLSASIQMRRCLETTVELPTLSFPSISGFLGRLEKDGAVLEPSQLGAIGVYAASSCALRAYLSSAAGDADAPGVRALADRIPDVAAVADRVSRVIDSDGTIREREIPELKRIRAQITAAERDVQREAQALLGRDGLRRVWNSTVPTQRGGRTVLPLKADHRGKVRGIVHEVSATGATIFVEPDSLVERNNAVTEAENRYERELLRLLRELTSFCAEHRGDLAQCLCSVTAVDRIYARARYAIAHACTPASPGDGRIAVRGARHPLLGTEAVPITIELPPGKRVMVITGPNTGGKTVSLKTVGLLAAMNQFGMEIPAESGSELPTFSGIFADIGDEQSIEQNLSTFSGHMRTIGRILSSADDRALVLLDELGSGTDPEEGGVLAMAILDELLERGPYSIVTTHHGVLKHYGFTQPAATNASVEFDMKSLRPTYHIVPGVPGSSHAIEVAAHMGMLRRVTAAAKAYLTGGEYDTGHIIRTLTDREQDLHREREALKRDRASLDSERRELDALREALSLRERDVRDHRLRDLEAWSAGARRELENLVREIREGELTREKTIRVKKFIARTRDHLDRERSENAAPRLSSPNSLRDSAGADASEHREPAVGATVRLDGSGKTGIILRSARGDKWQVQVGAVRLDVPASEFSVVPTRPETAPVVSVAPSGRQPRLELDVRGKRLQEALDEVDRQIDQAVMSGMGRFAIIHGTGEGVLQKGIHAHLKHNAHVGTLSFARPEDGGFGKTIVELG